MIISYKMYVYYMYIYIYSVCVCVPSQSFVLFTRGQHEEGRMEATDDKLVSGLCLCQHEEWRMNIDDLDPPSLNIDMCTSVWHIFFVSGCHCLCLSLF